MSGTAHTVKVGITGAIGTGKSEVCRILQAKGYPVVDADQVARDLTESSDEIRQALRQRFGTHFFDERGHLKRRELARVVFEDAGALRDLNAIVHPPMIAAIKKKMDELAREGWEYVFVEAAVIFEAQMADLFDVVATVAADMARAVERVAQNKGLSPEEVWQRYRVQIPLEEKIRRADYVIWNNGTLEDLRQEVDRFLQWLSTLRSGASAPNASEGPRWR